MIASYLQFNLERIGQMRKFTWFTITLVGSIFLLFGCNNDSKNDASKGPKEENVSKNENVNETDKENTTEDEETGEADTDLDAFINDVTEANLSLKSYSIETTIDSHQSFDGSKDHTIITKEQDTILNPLQTKKYMITEQQEDSDYDVSGVQDEEILMYNIDGYNYVNYKGVFGEGDQWLKTTNEFSEDDMRKQEEINIKAMLEDFEEFVTNITMSEESDTVRLTLEVDVDKITEIEKDELPYAQTEDEEANELFKDTYTVTQMDFQMIFDKETNYLIEINDQRTYFFDMEFDGSVHPMENVEDTITTYLNHNAVDEITLPEEAIKNAKENTDDS